jgi:cytochrome c554/c'-like protein
MNGKQLLGLLVLVGGIAGSIAILSGDPDGGGRDPVVEVADPAQPGDNGAVAQPAAERAPFQTASECRSCHTDVWDEWTKSYHGQAWTDPMVQALSNGFRMTECIDCHAPQPIHLTGVDQRVAPRSHSRNDGVDCLSCHILEDGVSVAAGRNIDTSATAGACRPVHVPSMTDSSSCAGCHNQHETLNELAESGMDKTCLDCHMRPAERVGRSGRSHLFPGAHSIEMHRKAVELEVEIKDGEVVASVTNRGAGHNVPTDARHRSYNLWITFYDSRGNIVGKREQMINGEYRLYYRSDFRESTQLRHGKTRSGTWPLPDGQSGKATVELTYALNPELLQKNDVFDVHRQEISYP